MKVYKLTTQAPYTTYNNTVWGENVTHEISAERANPDLCSDSWIHFYTSPLIAVLRNPRDANISNPVLWEAEACGEINIQPLKGGCKQLTTLRKIRLPVFTETQIVCFGILCAKQVCKEESWINWAEKYLNGTDRTKESASSASSASSAAFYASASAHASSASAACAASSAAFYALQAVADKPLIDFNQLAEQALSYE